MPSERHRWLALTTAAFGGRGGIAQYNRDFLTALAGNGGAASISVMVRQGPDPIVLSGSIEQAPARAGQLPYALTAAVAALRRPVDAVFCGHLHMAALAAAIARWNSAKLIVQMHGIEAWRPPSRLRRAAVESADLVLCVSRHTRARVLEWAAIAPERAVVLPNTVGDAFIAGEAQRLRAEMGLSGRRVLLTVGRLDARERYKGQDRVIAAMPALVAEGRDLVYLIAGEGDDEARLRHLAREAGVADRVRFLGAVEPARLASLYRLADLFVMPSTDEGFGIAYLEAMASGTPALGLAAAGAVDALADGELGTLVSESELAAAIARLLEAPGRDGAALSAAVRARFGRPAFAACLGAALGRIGLAA